MFTAYGADGASGCAQSCSASSHSMHSSHCAKASPGPGVQRREGPDDARLALRDDQFGIRDDEHRRSDDGQAQAPHFYMQAGLNYERMGFFDKLIMKGLSAMMSKKKDKTPDEEGTAQAIGSSFDASSRDYIKPLVEYVRSINK